MAGPLGGHAPVADLKWVLAHCSEGVRGLAVEGMRIGSPTTSVQGMGAQHYEVIACGPGVFMPDIRGKTFRRHGLGAAASG